MIQLAYSFICLFIFLVISTASDVIELNESNFNSSIYGDSASIWFVRFHAPWCHHCKSMKPDWEAVATRLKGVVSVADVDATVHLNVSKRFDIRSYPTIKLFFNGTFVNYHGPRQKDAMEAYAAGMREAIRRGEIELSSSDIQYVMSVASRKTHNFLQRNNPLYIIGLVMIIVIVLSLILLSLFLVLPVDGNEDEEEVKLLLAKN